METKLMKGNEALAEAAIQAGCDAYFGYPITPQSEVLEYLAREIPKYNSKEHIRIVLQAESEVASINMVYGAAGAGFRAMTSYQSDAGRHFLYSRRRASMPDRKCKPRRSRTRNDSARSG